jgi:GntR family transcriptional regulator of arabinose operon
MKQQVAELREKLFQNDLQGAEADDLLPSENELVDKYGFSLAVIRNMFRNLQDEGLAIGRQGKGIFLTKKINKFNSEPNFKNLKIAIVCFIQEDHPMSTTSQASKILASFEAKGSVNNCTTRLYNLWPANDLTVEMLQDLKDNNADGIIFNTNQNCPDEEIYKKLSLLDKPLIVVGTGDLENINTVTFENYQMSVTAVNCLTEKGHNKLGFIQYSGSLFWQKDRINGFEKTVLDNGIKGRQFEIPKKTPNQELSSYIKGNILPTLLNEKITGVVCSGDIFAAALIDVLKEAGKTVPEDIAIVSIDDDWCFRHYDITTIQRDSSRLGEAAFDLMCDIIASPKKEIIKRKVVCPLIIRSTT